MKRDYMSKYAICLLLASLTACSSAYYGTMEQLGVHKRDILVDRVEEARDSQEDASEQFSSALEEFTALTNFDGDNLQATYRRLNGEFEESQRRAARVNERIDAVERVARDLFSEWEDELAQYSSVTLRASSEESLRETRRRYDDLIRAMRRAEDRMPPVLDAFQDQVLFLKHNLNAQAIASLRSELETIESDVSVLVQDMQAAIAESERFLSAMRLDRNGG